jgi:paraquat-inducible protein A
MVPKRALSRRLPLALLLAAAICLVIGLLIPIVSIRRGVSRHTYSVLSGVYELVRGGHAVLGMVVFGFSVVFPIAKLSMLALVVLGMARENAGRTVRWLTALGKWSMLDVFVVALLIAATELGILSDAEPRYGVLLFGTGILLSMICAAVVSALTPPRAKGSVELGDWGPRVLTLASTATFVAGLTQPLMEVDKWLFWSNEFSALEAIAELFDAGNHVLAATLIAFVVAFPLARFAAVLAARIKGSLSAKAFHRLLWLDEWAMLDVYCLALMVVVLKVRDVAGVTPQSGIWLLTSAGILSLVDSWLLRTELEQRERRKERRA